MTADVTINSIPHREPFLFVDEIVELSADRIVTRKRVDPAADFFRGHYPQRPVMPGVLLCECAFQAGALLMARRIGPYGADGPVPVVTRIGDARFKRMVNPGESLDVEVKIDEELDGASFMTGWIRVGSELALRLTFAVKMA